MICIDWTSHGGDAGDTAAKLGHVGIVVLGVAILAKVSRELGKRVRKFQSVIVLDYKLIIIITTIIIYIFITLKLIKLGSKRTDHVLDKLCHRFKCLFKKNHLITTIIIIIYSVYNFRALKIRDVLVENFQDGVQRLLAPRALDHGKGVGVAGAGVRAGGHGRRVPLGGQSGHGGGVLRPGGPLEVMCKSLMHLLFFFFFFMYLLWKIKVKRETRKDKKKEKENRRKWEGM